MHWKMLRYTLQSMGRTKHKFPVYATQNVQIHLKLTIWDSEHFGTWKMFFIERVSLNIKESFITVISCS